MVLFFQFDLPKRFGLPFRPGSHLSVFMCPVHNWAPDVPSRGGRLPARYWKRRDGPFEFQGVQFWQAILHPPGVAERVHALEPHLVHQSLSFHRRTERLLVPRGEDLLEMEQRLGLRPGGHLPPRKGFLGVSRIADYNVRVREGFKVGGQPSWRVREPVLRCACGGPMTFVCQVPLDFPFPRTPGAAEQPDTFDEDAYGLFLGNETYLFACEAQCSPFAVYAEVQN